MFAMFVMVGIADLAKAAVLYGTCLNLFFLASGLYLGLLSGANPLAELLVLHRFPDKFVNNFISSLLHCF